MQKNNWQTLVNSNSLKRVIEKAIWKLHRVHHSEDARGTQKDIEGNRNNLWRHLYSTKMHWLFPKHLVLCFIIKKAFDWNITMLKCILNTHTTSYCPLEIKYKSKELPIRHKILNWKKNPGEFKFVNDSWAMIHTKLWYSWVYLKSLWEPRKLWWKLINN